MCLSVINKLFLPGEPGPKIIILSGFLSVSGIKKLGIFLPSPQVDTRLVHYRATLSINFSTTHTLHTHLCGEAHCESKVSRPRPLLGLEPGLFNPGSDNSVWCSWNCVCSDEYMYLVCFNL